jgi:hypothetical protein
MLPPYFYNIITLQHYNVKYESERVNSIFRGEFTCKLLWKEHYLKMG